MSEAVFETSSLSTPVILRTVCFSTSIFTFFGILKLIFDNEVIDTWSDKKWPDDMLSELEWLIREQSKIGNILKKGNLILTGAYGLPIPIYDKEFVEVKSTLFGNVSALFKNE